MSSELRLKKLRGSGGYVMATVTDEQQMKGNLGGPDLFLAPIGRLDVEKITKHFCNTCEKEFEGAPKIEFENPNVKPAQITATPARTIMISLITPFEIDLFANYIIAYIH